MEVLPPICLGCQRYRSTVDLDVGPTCEAFPDGIPDEIFDGGFDHRAPFDGDHGLLFVQADTAEAEAAVTLYERTKSLRSPEDEGE